MKVAIIKKWRKYNLPHVMCGFIDETEFGAYEEGAAVTFGDGSWIQIKAQDRNDIIITNVMAEDIEE